MTELPSIEAAECASEIVATTLPKKQATNLSQAFDALFTRLDYRTSKRFLGRHKAILELLGNRTTIDTIRQWQHGRRPTPRWVRRIVHDELTHRANTMLAIAVKLAAEQDGPGSGDSLRRYWAKKKAAQREAASKNYPQEN